MESYIAVFDVGKTNKKVMIFDERLALVDSVKENFSEYSEDGVNYERIDEMTEWFLDGLKGFSSRYSIRAVSVTTHGASAACVDSEGRLVLPLVAYTTDPGEEFHRDFHRRFGSVEDLQRSTATPPMGGLTNTAKLIYYLKNRYPEDFERVDTILTFPQYFGFVLTGEKGADPTYVGCHSYLWNPHEMRWSSVARDMGIVDKLPKRISKSWDVLGTLTPETAKRTGLSTDTLVTMGIHDSNASLLPYLVKTEEEFVLNSTGTWCVIMHPSKKVSFREEELGKPVFFNQDVFSRPVKTALVMGGLEFEVWSEILKDINDKEGYPDFNPALYRKLFWGNSRFILPSVQKGTGQFPDSDPRAVEGGRNYPLETIRSGGDIPPFFGEYTAAFAALNISLAIQTKIALERAGTVDGTTIFVEGGFRKNPDYNTLLSALFPKSKVYLTNLSEATAFGAALLAKAALDGTDPKTLGNFFEIETKEVKREQFDGLSQYVDSFFEHLEGGR
jgi:sugar (pentulose or hexulose) kinase